MDLTYREVEERDFEICREILQDRDHYPPNLLAALPEIWRRWRAGGALGAAVMESRNEFGIQEIVQFGMSVFVTEEFMAEMREADSPPLGVCLAERVLAGRSPVLDLPAIRTANSGAGLNLVVGFFGFRERGWTQEQSSVFFSRMPESFLWLHEGYNFREMLQEYQDARIVQFCLAAGFVQRGGLKGNFSGHVGMTREEAAANPGAYVAKLFPYSAPRFGFSVGEQQVLRQALLGRGDEENAALLHIALSTVKKRWAAIYGRVCEKMPEMLPFELSPKRGQEKRRLLLAYLRQHPEELRPYAAGKTTR